MPTYLPPQSKHKEPYAVTAGISSIDRSNNLNNILEQDHRAIKRRVKAKQSFRDFQAARRTIAGYEAIA